MVMSSLGAAGLPEADNFMQGDEGSGSGDGEPDIDETSQGSGSGGGAIVETG